MLSGIVTGIITAWFLAVFDVDKFCIDIMQSFVKNIKLQTKHFYFVFGALGLIGGLISDIIH